MWTPFVIGGFLMASGLVLGAMGSSDNRVSCFALGATLFGSMVFAFVRPIYGDESAFFSGIGLALCCVGAMVSGASSTLMPEWTMAASGGALLGLPLLLALEGRWNPGLALDTFGNNFESAVSILVYALLVAIVCSGMNRFKKPVESTVFSAAGAWLVVLGLDRALSHGEILWARVVVAARGGDVVATYPANDDTSNGLSEPELSHGYEAAGIAAWIAFSVGISLFRAAANGSLCQRPRRNGGYRRVPGQPESTKKKGEEKKESANNEGHKPTASATHQANLLAERPMSYNLFDPEKLPSTLQRFAPQIFASAEALGNFFGFQDDSVRSQAEHALALLANSMSQQQRWYDTDDEDEGDESPLGEEAEDAAIRALHAKLFSNYRSWCAALETVPQFAPPAESRHEPGGAATDVMLWLCVWGEAGNLRHMPECLCFLYHSAAAEWASTPKREREGERGATLDAGHWLDTVVTPLYLVVAANMKKKADHVEKLSYDDINEFFWSKSCLECHRSSVMTATARKHLDRRNAARRSVRRYQQQQQHAEGSSLLRSATMAASAEGNPPSIADRLKGAPKTYLEVRTWLHVIYAFQRIYEFHVLTFMGLAVIAFWRFLIWDWTYALQVASMMAAAQNVCALCWTFLEALIAPPAMDDLQRVALCARLAARFIALVVQATYLSWSFDELEAMPMVEVRRTGDGSFWWWQHVWVSAVIMVGYFIEAFLQLWPRGMSYLLEVRGDVWRAILAIFEPKLSALYVGKSVHEPYSLAWKYHVYWASLIAFKMWFGYQFLIKPLVSPSVQIYDDYLNFPQVPNRTMKTAIQLFGRWSPSVLIFLVDSSIWYSLWTAAVGTYVGFAVKLGVVRDLGSLRDAFLLLPRAFCDGLVAGSYGENKAAQKMQQRQQMEDEDDVGRFSGGSRGSTGSDHLDGSQLSPRSNVEPKLRRYFDEGPIARQRDDGCLTCCGGGGGGEAPYADSRGLQQSGSATRRSSRGLGSFISPQSSSTDVSASLGAASTRYGSGLAPRLPSFVSLTDTFADKQEPLGFKVRSDPMMQDENANSTPAVNNPRAGVVELMSNGGKSRRNRLSEVFSGANDEAQWILFAEAWNEVIEAMRASDVLSNKERDILAFDRFSGFSKPVYLPIFVTAGAMERCAAMAADAVASYRPLAAAASAARYDAADLEDGAMLERQAERYAASASQINQEFAATLQGDVVACEALDEARELVTWLILQLLGGVHRDDVVAIVSIFDRWSRGDSSIVGETMLDRVKVEDAQRSILAPLSQLVDVLLKGLPKRKVVVPSVHTTQHAPSASAKSSDHAHPPQPVPPTPAPTPVTSSTNLALEGEEKQEEDHRVVRHSTKSSAELPLESSSTKKSASGIKRTQSTSGLVNMASGFSDPLKASHASTEMTTKKYSLSSNKYVSGKKKSGDGGLTPEASDPFRDAVRDKLRALLSGLKASVLTKGSSPQTSLARKSAQEVSDRLTFVAANERGFFWDGAYAGACLDGLRGDLERTTKILKKLRGLLSTPQRETEPRGHEATRRLTFFVNSLLMDLPPPPPVEAMVSFTTLTPFYSEDVILSKSDLLAKNSDGVTTLLYLQTLYKADWENYLERIKIRDETAVFKPEHELETRLWASFRAQTLARTVEGMMHCEAALRLLTRLERLNAVRQARLMKTRANPRGSGSGSPEPPRGSSSRMIMPGSSGASVDDIVKLKFGYVVSCQVYGKQRKNADPKAKDIELLLHRFPLLRIAYIDEARVNRTGTVAYYSVLVKSGSTPAHKDTGAPAAARALMKGGRLSSAGSSSDSMMSASAPALVSTPDKPRRKSAATASQQPEVVEIYRVRLPGNPVIGEGKPENQNHAIIFTRGECLQTIDMNQDGFFEEALKMRNLMQEFRPGAPGVPKVRGALPTVIVGFREHIFTGSVSSLANYMALQELCFVTLGQRVLSDPLRIRLHYGHPDVFDKLWFATRGGISKASKGINLSEDIFAGYTAIIRGGAVTMKEYCQVGKGRDVGMQQIYKFEAKLSQGNAEQCLSRDASRLSDRLDFPRLLGYYFGGIGHYVNSALTVATIQVATYLALVLAVFGAESIGGRQVVPLGSVQIVLAGLGLLNTLPLLATLAVERGLLPALRDVLQVFASGGPLYFVFHIQTRAHYFLQTLLAGGASYKATGRGFVTRHSTFDEQYRFFATSHLYLGVELAAALILIGVYSEARQYAGRTWSLWLATVAFLLSPFWFNPLGFSWPHVTDDFRKWARWISPYTRGGTSSDSWEVWYKEETSVYRRLSWQSKLLIGSKAIAYVFLARGLAWRSGADDSESVRLVELAQLDSFGMVVAALCALALASTLVDASVHRLHYALHRLLKMLIGVACVAVVVVAFLSHSSFFHFAVSLYYVAAAINIVGTLVGASFVRHLQRLHDALIGYVFFAIFLLLSALHVFDVVQTWLLFHNAVSQGVVVDNILKQARRSQEADDTPDTSVELRELRQMVEQQNATIATLMSKVNAEKSPAAHHSSPPPPPLPTTSDVGNSGASNESNTTMRTGGNPSSSKRSTSAVVNFDLGDQSSPPPADSSFSFRAPDHMPPRS